MFPLWEQVAGDAVAVPNWSIRHDAVAGSCRGGISQRMVAYYEREKAHPPTHLLPVLAKALGVSADQLLGLEKVQQNGRSRDTRLWRRFSQVEKLPPAQRRPIIQLLDAFLAKAQPG